jgi:hypothetical protein
LTIYEEFWSAANPQIFKISLSVIQKLRGAVDLIVITTVGESQNFMQKLCEPWRFPGQVNLAALETGSLRFHSHKLIALWLNALRKWNAIKWICPQILNELHAEPCML